MVRSLFTANVTTAAFPAAFIRARKRPANPKLLKLLTFLINCADRRSLVSNIPITEGRNEIFVESIRAKSRGSNEGILETEAQLTCD